MDTALANVDMQYALANAQHHFNALAEVAGKEMAQYVKPAVVVPLTIGVAALGGAVEARFPTKGAIANAIVAAGAYAVGFMAGDNADLRWTAYSIAMGLGSAASACATSEKVTDLMSNTSAPAAQ